jgi:hypothetical protein
VAKNCEFSTATAIDEPDVGKANRIGYTATVFLYNR